MIKSEFGILVVVQATWTRFHTAAHSSLTQFNRSLSQASSFPALLLITTPVTDTMRSDIRIWLEFLKSWNHQARWRRHPDPITIHHDASKHGFGFYLSGLPDDFPVADLPVALRPGNSFAGAFSDSDLRGPVARNICWAELFAIVYSLALYGPYFANRDITVFTDNMSDVSIINRQSTTDPELLALLRLLYLCCVTHNIGIRAEHVPGVDNVVADFLSRPALHLHANHVPANHHPAPLCIHHVHSSLLVTTAGCPRTNFNC